VPGKCLLRTERPEDYPEILEMLKVSGEHCTVLKVAVGSINHLEAFNERLGQHGELRTSMIWGAAFTRRVLDWEGGVPEVPPAPGWE
jgi:Lrp/AsnC family leucine-responsive transcriptional regulator